MCRSFSTRPVVRKVVEVSMRTERKTMPIGVDDFAKLIRGGYCFIDKTRFIKEILDGRS
ncbi:MAG: AAA family ATPase, partial [Selenomonadaceae bacterium]|nr:AAA family ATPase [Selenomonadaceae bacterium]